MGWYLTITSEMREAGLNGNGLLIYAIVHGYSQESDGCCYLSLPSLAKRAGCTPETARTTLRSLMDAGFVERLEFMDGNIHRVAYRATPKIWGVQIFREDPQKNLGAPPKNFGPYNKSNIKEENKEYRDNNAHARFIPPTLEEVAQYCASRGNTIDPQNFVDYYTAIGWRVGRNPMKDWQAAVRQWEQRRKNETPNPRPFPRQQKESVYEHNARALEEAQRRIQIMYADEQ